MVITTGKLSTVFPFSVAFTKRVTVPVLTPAVKVTEEPELGLSVPRLLVNDHA